MVFGGSPARLRSADPAPLPGQTADDSAGANRALRLRHLLELPARAAAEEGGRRDGRGLRGGAEAVRGDAALRARPRRALCPGGSPARSLQRGAGGPSGRRRRGRGILYKHAHSRYLIHR